MVRASNTFDFQVMSLKSYAVEAQKTASKAVHASLLIKVDRDLMRRSPRVNMDPDTRPASPVLLRWGLWQP